jgi:5-methylcytosine-specific restriction protein A
MNTYLFTWNPKQWQWEDLGLRANENASGKIISERWSCHANSKRIKMGDRAFLIRLGEEPKGIIASGWTTSEPQLGVHWKKAKASLGEKTHFADCEWERLLNPFIDSPLPISRLQSGKLAAMHWTPQSSGVLIPSGISEDLEHAWAEHFGASSLGSVFVDDEISAFEGEERIALIRHRKREQKLRNAKFKQAKENNRGRLICEVPGCGFDFELVYGELGKDFAHIHHLNPLADKSSPSLTRLDDLVVVCANCHAMIHKGGKCRPLENLIQKQIT